ncbi:MAG: methyltransferase [Pseudomonadota bacterium]
MPFYLPTLPWENAYGELAQALRSLDDHSAAMFESDSEALLSWLREYVSDAASIAQLQRIPSHEVSTYRYPSHTLQGVPGRKWQQITAFADCIEKAPGPILEWCAGKAHLGRLLAHRYDVAVTALEWDESLCQAGNQISAQQRLDVKLAHCDVLSPSADDFVADTDHTVALHACGDLHRRLIELVVNNQVRHLQLSPCCFHLTKDELYLPFSSAGKHCELHLTSSDCRLAVQETVTASARETRTRDRKNAWRLGFDQLQRELRARDEYLPVPPLADSVLQTNFKAFCQQAAALKQLALPDAIDWARYEANGWQRLAEVRRMELPRHAFRRVLELWLVLDRALYLQEAGYEVKVSRFCEREVTPRNLMISASFSG